MDLNDNLGFLELTLGRSQLAAQVSEFAGIGVNGLGLGSASIRFQPLRGGVTPGGELGVVQALRNLSTKKRHRTYDNYTRSGDSDGVADEAGWLIHAASGTTARRGAPATKRCGLAA